MGVVREEVLQEDKLDLDPGLILVQEFTVQIVLYALWVSTIVDKNSWKFNFLVC